MHIISDKKLDFSDVLLIPKRSKISSRGEVVLERTFKFINTLNFTTTVIPIISSNMVSVTGPQMSITLGELGLMGCLHKHINYKDKEKLVEGQAKNVILSIGTKALPDHYDLEGHVVYLEAHGVPVNFICVDVANGYSEKFVQTVTSIKQMFPDKVIMAGNVVTPEMVEALILAGADVVKIGIGPGSACTTRVKTGVGYPQLSAIIECADAAHGLGGHIISDGGCSTPGDVCKAFAGGADFVMLGGMFAGTDECGGEVIEKDGKKYMEFYGMSSKKANEKFAGGMQSYRSSEGRELLVPYKGSVHNVVQDILGGLRSCCSYLGAKTLKELPKRATFVRVNNQFNRSLEKYEEK